MRESRSSSTDRTDSHRFKHVEDLRMALDEYAAFHDGTVVRKYGPPPPSEAGPRTGDEMAASQERIMRQNKTIDRAMRRLAVMAPLSHRLLHGYNRRSGPSGTPANPIATIVQEHGFRDPATIVRSR